MSAGRPPCYYDRCSCTSSYVMVLLLLGKYMFCASLQFKIGLLVQQSQNIRYCFTKRALNIFFLVIAALFYFFPRRERTIVGCLVLSAPPAFDEINPKCFCIAYKCTPSCKINTCATVRTWLYDTRYLALLGLLRQFATLH